MALSRWERLRLPFEAGEADPPLSPLMHSPYRTVYERLRERVVWPSGADLWADDVPDPQPPVSAHASRRNRGIAALDAFEHELARRGTADAQRRDARGRFAPSGTLDLSDARAILRETYTPQAVEQLAYESPLLAMLPPAVSTYEVSGPGPDAGPWVAQDRTGDAYEARLGFQATTYAAPPRLTTTLDAWPFPATVQVPVADPHGGMGEFRALAHHAWTGVGYEPATTEVRFRLTTYQYRVGETTFWWWGWAAPTTLTRAGDRLRTLLDRLLAPQDFQVTTTARDLTELMAGLREVRGLLGSPLEDG